MTTQDGGNRDTIGDMADALVKQAVVGAKIRREDGPRFREEWYQELWGARHFILERFELMKQRIVQMTPDPRAASALPIEAFPKPRWDKWLLFPEVTLLEAAALSLDVAPEIPNSGLVPALVGERLELIRRHADAQTLSTVLRPSATDQYQAVRNVTLADLATWATRLKLPLPAEFPRAAAAGEEPAPSRPAALAEGPLHPKERTSLLVIIGALVEHAKLDIKKSSATADVVVAAADRVGVPISQNTVAGFLKEVPEALDSRRKK